MIRGSTEWPNKVKVCQLLVVMCFEPFGESVRRLVHSIEYIIFLLFPHLIDK